MKISVLDMGAVAGMRELQTQAFQMALDEVWQSGGGTVVVPAGEYHIGAIRLRSYTTLYLCAGAKIFGSRVPEDYYILQNDTLEPLPDEMRTEKLYERPPKDQKRDYSFMLPGGRWSNGLIRACCAENIAIIGEPGSVIDGRDCYDEVGEESYRGPHGISVHHCKNVYMSGYTIQNTGNWAHNIHSSQNICCEGVTVLAGHDGVHFGNCENITVKDCEFYTGDDCVAGFANVNTHVYRCVLNTACSGLRLGGTNVLVEQCRFYGPAKYFFRGSLSVEEKKNGAAANRPHRTNMLSVFTYYADFSMPIPVKPGNIIIKDCTADHVDRFLHYNYSGNERWQANKPLSSLMLENIQATGISMPITLYGSEQAPLDFTMKDVTVAFADREDGASVPVFRVAHCRKMDLERVSFIKNTDGDLIRSWSAPGDIRYQNVTYHVPQEKWFALADEPFVCKAI
ncbi:MAG: right-handed parallel beta-helix repeat-containing protein [Clostridia bacterium]|nr:right-handed parallel beta-helix repeat-containing protein [Clostridia bacterium]